MKSSFARYAKGPTIYRVCVDELIQTVARLLVAPLKPGIKEFDLQELEVWEDEFEFYLEDLEDLSRSRLSGPGFQVEEKANRDHPFWRALRSALSIHWPPKEGLLYIVGHYRLEGDDPPRVFLDPSAELAAHRVDRLDPVKRYLKNLYTSALTTGGDHDAASDH